jgi:hypothetical protein
MGEFGLSVTDTMDEKTKKHLFEPFFTTKDKDEPYPLRARSRVGFKR